MKKRLIIFISLMLIFSLFNTPIIYARKYRIGYLEGGYYPTYEKLFKAMMLEFKHIGWHNKIEFPCDACFSANWNRKKCKEMAEKLASRKDLDMIWGFGTWAGQELVKTSNYTTPMVIMSVSNAVKAGIVPSYKDSGRDNLTTRIDPTKYERQIRLFYQLFRFKKLGFVYADTLSGRTYAAIDTLKKLSKELGFELVGYGKVPENKKEAPTYILKGIREIAPRIDAFYVTICIGFELEQVPKAMAILNKYKIPTMSMYGADYVKAGILLTIADSKYKQRARFNVAKIVKILEGKAKPRDLPIVFAPGPRLAINLAEAKIIEWDPPIDILGISDNIYNEIKSPKEIKEEERKEYTDITIWNICTKKK